MFTHRQDLQFKTTPERPDPWYAGHLEQALGHQYGEIVVGLHYLDHGSRIQGRYRDLVMALGVEQVAHVEMLARLVARLLDHAPDETVGQAHPAVAAVIGGTDLEDAIAAGCVSGAPDDAVGTNLYADLRTNAHAEQDRRRELPTLDHFTDDSDIHYLLTCLLGRALAQQHTCEGILANLPAHQSRHIY